MFILNRVKGLVAGCIGLLMLWAVPAQAALISYYATFTVNNLGSAETVLIDSSDIAIGDTYYISFTLNDQSPIVAINSNPSDYYYGFSNTVTSLSVTAAPGNTGTYTPTWSSYVSPIKAMDVEGKVQLGFDLRLNGGNSVDFTQGGGSPTSGTLPFRFIHLRFDTDLDFDTSAVMNDPLSDFLSPTESWTVSGISFDFIRTTPTAITGSVTGTGTIASVPEPGTMGLVLVGAVGCLFLRRRMVMR